VIALATNIQNGVPSNWVINGDHKSDILLQNTDGTPTVWTTDGTTVTTTTTLTNPGQTWHPITR